MRRIPAGLVDAADGCATDAVLAFEANGDYAAYEQFGDWRLLGKRCPSQLNCNKAPNSDEQPAFRDERDETLVVNRLLFALEASCFTRRLRTFPYQV